MAKCELCGKGSKTEITIKAYNHSVEIHSAVICGVCALDKEIIIDPEIVKIIREAEGIPEGKACSFCSHLLTVNAKSGGYFCQRYAVPLSDQDVRKNYCECFERARK